MNQGAWAFENAGNLFEGIFAILQLIFKKVAVHTEQYK